MTQKILYREYEHFITKIETEDLLNHFLNSQQLWHKPTGPITLSLDHTNQNIYGFLLERIARFINMKVYFITGNFFNTKEPYIIHCDGETNKEILRSYHVALFPLSFYPSTVKEESHLFLFNNFFYSEPSKFFLGEPSVNNFKRASYPLKNISEGITNYNKSVPKVELPELSHLRKTWLDGLTIHQKISWIPRKLIIFPSAQLHCSSNFKNLHIDSKIGLSMVLDIRE